MATTVTTSTSVVAMSQPVMATFGSRLSAQFQRYMKDRYPLEQQWMRNLRQYRGIYDPEAVIRPFGSTAYPKFTRKWVNATVSRLMQMLFPQTEKNWTLRPSEISELPRADLENLLNMMQQSAQQAGTELKDEDIQKQVQELAKARCEGMIKQMNDQLDEMDYVALARKVVKSGVLYGTGLLTGPLIKKEKHCSWRKDIQTGRFIVEEKDRIAPTYDSETVWDWYPDLSAKTRESQDGYYFRRVMSREQIRKVAERPDFMGSRIIEWLRTHQDGNYVEQYWELEVRVDGDRKYTTEINKRKYQLLEWWGFVSGAELKACGVAIPDDQLGEQFESNVWQIDDLVIKCLVNPFEKKRRPLHDFVFEEDDMNLAGVGLPQVCRDSQLAICESARMLLDNGSVICTPSKLIKLGLLMPNHSLDSRPYQDWYQDPDALDNAQDAVKNLTFDGHLAELQQVVELFRRIGEDEVSLPPITAGDVSAGGSEGLRTQGNMSMAMGAASLPIRDTVRNFDQFSESMISSLYDWNMEFNSNPLIKGDFMPVARGSTSLMAKEVRAQHLLQFAQTIQPEERIEVDWRKNITERIKSMDMLPDEVLADQETVEKNRAAQQEQAQKLASEQSALVQAEVRNVLSQAAKNVAQAKKTSTGADVDVYQAILAGIDQVASQEQNAEETQRQHLNDARSHVQSLLDLHIKNKVADNKPVAKAA